MAEKKKTNEALVERLTAAYWAEVETVMNYLAASINPDGVRAREIVEILSKDLAEELGHARMFGERIKELWGVVPGSLAFAPQQKYLQPPDNQTDIVHVIEGVIAAEKDAISMYQGIVDYCESFDLVTQDMVVQILHDEQKHLRLFEGFLREYRSNA